MVLSLFLAFRLHLISLNGAQSVRFGEDGNSTAKFFWYVVFDSALIINY